MTVLAIVLIIVGVCIALKSLAALKDAPKIVQDPALDKSSSTLKRVLIGLIICCIGWYIWPSRLEAYDSDKTKSEQIATDTIKQHIERRFELKKPDLSIQMQLAILDAKSMVPDTSLKVIRIKTLLDRLTKIYNQSPDTIAEWTSKAKGAIHDQGKEVTNLEILETMYSSGKSPNVNYQNAVTMYAYLKSR